MQEIKKAIQSVAEGAEFDLTRPDEKFGDYSTNIALKIAAKTGKNPRAVAEELAKKLEGKVDAKVEIAGPGFINLTLSDSVLWDQAGQKPAGIYSGKTIVIEHTDPNPFKEFHIGHAYSNTIGETLGRLFKAAGAVTHQVSYHGDAGLHIAMAIWGMQKYLKEKNQTLKDIAKNKRHEFLARSYAIGSSANKGNQAAASEIKDINKKIYSKQDKKINQLYDTGRAWSFAYFEQIYQKLGVKFEKQYFETDTGKTGLEIVKKHPSVFKESEGAVVYDGEKTGLHTRVFITREGLPTYEAKELGLAQAKQKDYPSSDMFVVVTANEIDEYFKVLLAALKEIDPKLAAKIRHISHGVVRLPSGKMSSRTGEVVTISYLLDLIEKAAAKIAKDDISASAAAIGALKFAFLKQRIGGNIIFDIKESVSLEGNSGPYLQYAHARARSILQKSKVESQKSKVENFEPGERTLLRKIGEYAEAVEGAAKELLPNHICTYLHELAQVFNRFYEQNRVIGDPREEIRLQLVDSYAQTLKNGLELLNIPAPEKM